MFDRGAGRVCVKICGITNRDDARAAIELGADALGFNTFRGSKRFVDLGAAQSWIAELPASVFRVAIMVDPDLAEATAVADRPFIDAVQFHGDESPEFCAEFARTGRRFIKAIPIGEGAPAVDPERFSTRTLLLDTWKHAQFGGSGQLIDLDRAADFVTQHRDFQIILSGGLTPSNVAEAVARIQPSAVDVATGVESSPGKKSRELIEQFIAEAKGVPLKL
jgi:phosphoribosylanthranilate isomerase